MPRHHQQKSLAHPQPRVSAQRPTEHLPHASTQLIVAADVPNEVWYGSAVLRELGHHPHQPPPPPCSHVHNSHVHAALDVSILFGYSTTHMEAAVDFVVHGHMRPASVHILSRLCLTTVAAMNTLGGDGRLRHSFRAVVRRHLEQHGPRTGLWEAVRGTPALVSGDVSGLKCKAWSTAPWTHDMSKWMQSVPMDRLCRNEWWWLVKRALKHHRCSRMDHTTALRAAAGRGNLVMVKQLCSLHAGGCCNSALQLAAAGGYLHVVAYLCSLPTERGVQPDADYNNAVRGAAVHGHLQVVQYLCSLPPERGVKPGARDNYALQFAAVHGHLQVVQYLCSLPPERGVKPDADDPGVLQ